jgi:hypothetical protein
MLGQEEAKSFELLLSGMADWFIDNPEPAWQQPLKLAAGSPHGLAYSY